MLTAVLHTASSADIHLQGRGFGLATASTNYFARGVKMDARKNVILLTTSRIGGNWGGSLTVVLEGAVRGLADSCNNAD